MKCKEGNENQQETKIILFFYIMTTNIPYRLSPGVKLPEDVIKALKNANTTYTKTRDFSRYTRTMQNILGLPDFVPFTENEKLFFGGFLEGEASISVGAKKNTSSRFGVYFDPEFNVTQHINGSIHLFRCLCHFRTGLIRYKSKSNATLVYTIDSRDSLKQKIVPFYQKYVNPFSCYEKQGRFQRWSTLLDLFDEKAHLDLNRFTNEIAPIWDELRMQKGQSNESFTSLEDFKQYVYAYLKTKNQM